MNYVTGSFYVVCSRKRNSNWFLTARMTTRAPRLKVGEVSVKLDIELPDSLFTRPSLVAKVVVPPSDVPKALITADVMDNVAQVLSEQLGMVVRVSAEGE